MLMNFKNENSNEMFGLKFIIIASTILVNLNIASGSEFTSSSSSTLPSSLTAQHVEFHEFLNTEKVLIDILRHYINVQENKLHNLKSKISEISNIHGALSDDKEKYLHNPFNVITILKRFTSDWPFIKNSAEELLNTEELNNNLMEQIENLTFPSEEYYEAAVINLLRLQDIYKLEPERLAMGVVNDIKLGTDMSWSDCLDLGLKSHKSGYQSNAKCWLETALKLIGQYTAITTQHNSTDFDQDLNNSTIRPDDFKLKAKVDVLKALFYTELKMGNLEKALEISEEILQINPKQKNILKAKQKIENDFKAKENTKARQTQFKKNKKSDEELMIGEICQDALNSQNQFSSVNDFATPNISRCSLYPMGSLLPFLRLQPLKIELISMEPYIAIYHNVLNGRQLEELKGYLIENENDAEKGEIFANMENILKFTGIGLKKMSRLKDNLLYLTGHHAEKSQRNIIQNDWQLKHYSFETEMELRAVHNEIQSSSISLNLTKAKLLFNLQEPLLGGAIVFPQLQLFINLPMGSILYWSTLNEFHAADYRSNYVICPIVAGSQITASTYIK